MTVDEEMLRAYVAGSLDPTEEADVMAWLDADPARGARVATLRTRLDPLEATPPRWRVPPPGYGWPAALSGATTLGLTAARIGGWFRVSAAPIEDADAREVFVLRNRGDTWERVAPVANDDRVGLGDLPVETDGAHRVDLRALGPAGTQRWLVAFPRRADVDQAAWPPDEWLRVQIRGNRLPVVSVTVDIAAD